MVAPIQRRYPYGESASWEDLDLSDEQLADFALLTAQSGIHALEQNGFDPGPDLIERAAGHPDRIAEYIDAYHRSRKQRASQ